MAEGGKQPRKKKPPPFYTDEDSMLSFGVQAKDLVIAAPGIVASVLGVKYPPQEDGDDETGVLWLEYRRGYRSPVETKGYNRCSNAANVWKDLHEFEKMAQKDEDMRQLVNDLNKRFKQGLTPDKKKKK